MLNVRRLCVVVDSLIATSFPGFSPTRPTERKRERPWKTLVTWLQNNGREEAFVSHFFVWFTRDVHAVIATAR